MYDLYRKSIDSLLNFEVSPAVEILIKTYDRPRL